jgi:hypothetical protein
MFIKTPIALVYNSSSHYSTDKPIHVRYSTQEEINWDWLTANWSRKIILNATIQGGEVLTVSGQLAKEYVLKEEDFEVTDLDAKVVLVEQSFSACWRIFGEDRQKVVDALSSKYVLGNISEKKTFWTRAPFLEFSCSSLIVKSTEGIPVRELVHTDRYLITHLSMG